MSLAPCSVAAPADEAGLVAPLRDRIEDLERRLAETTRGLRRAEATIALLNDRLAWAEADLAARSDEGAGAPTPLRPSG
jgi:hypothetical protein